MFKRRKPEITDVETLVGAGTRIEGDVRVGGGMHLEGHVKGNVVAAPGVEAALTIAERGVVEGVVEVPRVVVHGEVRGDIRARDVVELGPTARVSGNVVYGTIEMAAGAVIQGRLVSTAGEAAPAAAGPRPADDGDGAAAEDGRTAGAG